VKRFRSTSTGNGPFARTLGVKRSAFRLLEPFFTSRAYC